MKQCELTQQEINLAQCLLATVTHSRYFLSKANGHKQCGCACCGKVLNIDDIKEYEDGSAICPNCGMKTIVPDNHGFLISANDLNKYSRILYEILKDPGKTKIEKIFSKICFFIYIFHFFS